LPLVSSVFFEVREPRFREFLESNIGQIRAVSMPVSKKGRNLGYAYVQLKNSIDMMSALALSGVEFFGGNLQFSQSNRPITEKRNRDLRETGESSPKSELPKISVHHHTKITLETSGEDAQMDRVEQLNAPEVKNNEYFRKFLV
jgi:hypothetical protein